MGGFVQLGRWAVLDRKLRRSYWGGGLFWSESRGEVTEEACAPGAKAEEELLERWAGQERKQRRSYWRWAGLGRKQRSSYLRGGRSWGESRGGVNRNVGGAWKKAEEELLGRWAGLGRKQRRGYWGGGRGWEETEVSQVTSRGLAWWRPLRWPPEWQLRSCRDGLCQPDKRHRRKRRLGHNHGRDAQSSGETLGLRHQVFQHQH